MSRLALPSWHANCAWMPTLFVFAQPGTVLSEARSMLSLTRSRFSAHAVLIALSLGSSSACSGELDPVADTEIDVRDSASSGDSGADDGGVPDAQPGADAALPDTRSDAQLPDAGSENAGLASCGPAED